MSNKPIPADVVATLAGMREAAALTALHRKLDDGAGMRGERDADRKRNGRKAPRRQGTRAAQVRYAIREA